MKTVLLTLALFTTTFASAQWPCEVDTQYTMPGLYPGPDDIPCIVGGGVWNDITMQFVMLDSTDISGFTVKVQYVIIEEILNLPCGIRWTTSKQGADTVNRFNNQERGCIRIWGYTNDTPGQYKLEIIVRAKVSLLPGEVPYSAEDLGYRVDIRVKPDPCDSFCPSLDTSSNAVLRTASCNIGFTDTLYFEKQHLAAGPCDTVGITEIASINQFTFYPNPTNNTATISFTADRADAFTARIVNIYGQEVSNEQLNVVAGLNVSKVDVSNLAAGVYIFTITDGNSILTQRFVIEH